MKIKLYYHWLQYKWQGYDEGGVTVRDCDMSMSTDFTLLAVIDIDAPDIGRPTEDQVRNSLVATLTEEKRALQAEVFVKIKTIDDKIQQLTCIENKS